jgi:PAS domain S-box-containing protein
MNDQQREQLDEQVLVLAPTARDAATSRGLLEAAGIGYSLCTTIEDVCREAARGAGAAVVTAEAVLRDRDGRLAGWLKSQPPWSDFPLIVLTPPGAESPKLLEALDAVGHMTLMKRPVQVSTLVSTVRSALRDRRRQYAVRDLLDERRRAAEVLREERERYRVTLSSIGDAVIATDTAARVTFLNQVAGRLTGWDIAAAGGRPLEEVFRIVNESTRQPVPNPALRALKEGAVVGLSNHTVLLARDGTERPLEDSAAPIRGAQGEVVGTVLVFRDVTEKRRVEGALREQEKRAAAILESINEGFVVLGADWNFAYVNAAFERMNGVRREDILGRNHWEVYPATVGTPLEAAYRRVLATGETAEFENYYEPWDRWFMVKAYPSRGGGLCVHVREVTDAKRAEAALREKDERLQLLVGHATDYALIMTDPGGRVLDWAGGAERITGWKEDEVRGQPAAVLFLPEDRALGRPEEEMREAAEAGRAADKRWHLRKDGSRFFADGVMVALRGPGGELRGFGKVFQDVTDRKQAEEALARDALLLANVHDAVVVTDLEGVVTYWNDGATRLFGWTAEEMVGRPYADRFSEPVRSWVAGEVRSRAEGSEWSGEYEDYRKDGSRVWIDSRVTPVNDAAGKVVGILGLSHDITERKRAEEALKEADRRKDDFIALLAHELRNPLAPVRNGLQVMRLAGGDASAVAQARAMMDRQLGHMVRLIDDLLDVSRISRNKMELRRARVLLADVVSNAVETARPAIEAAGHELTVSLPPQPIFLDADLTRLAQVFGNLLSNSAKYTERGGRIWLSAERQKSTVTVSVRDTGIGIPADALPRIFDMFSQVDRSIERSTGGLGIGLALVKGLVEMHGGTVAAESAGPGKGSAFTVRLPVLESPSEPLEVIPPDDRQAVRGPGGRVLVVDDNRDSAASMAMMLKLLGDEVVTAHDGIEAGEAAERFRPEVILMDVGMPRLNGLDATRRIREQPWGKGLTIIALTGWGQEGDRVQSKEAGCDGHLVKPVHLPDLEKVLAELAAKRGPADAGPRQESPGERRK